MILFTKFYINALFSMSMSMSMSMKYKYNHNHNHTHTHTHTIFENSLNILIKLNIYFRCKVNPCHIDVLKFM
jgi:hypothetical protein